MPRVEFTAHLRRHLDLEDRDVAGDTVRTALEAAFLGQPKLRGYVLDDTGALRRHMVIFVDGEQIVDRAALSDPVNDRSTVYVLQALSGG